MGILPRSSRAALPEAVSAALELRRGERVLAWGSGPVVTAAGVPGRAYVVATDRALHLPPLDAAGVETSGVRVPWDLVERASWADGVLDLALREAPGARPRRRVVALDDEQELPVVVRERVTATIEVQQRLRLDEVEDDDGRPAGVSGGIAVAARRASDTGELRWQVSFDTGTDGRDPAVRAAAAKALADLRGALGL